MAKYTDEQGKVIETSLDLTAIETIAKEKADLEAKHKILEEDFNKLKGKDANFSALRKVTAEEKAKILATYSQKEQDIFNELEGVKSELSDYKNKNLQKHERAVLRQLAGDDKDLAKRIQDASKSFSGDVKDEEDLENRLRNGFTLVKGAQPTTSPLHSFVPSGEGENFFKEQGEKFTDTEAGRQLLQKSFPHLYPPTKK
jgi:uncharacterized membrane-anchored protein YhcB (DUF1043 family)